METEEYFKEHGYAVIKNMVHQQMVKTVTSYALLKEAFAFTPDENQVVGAHFGYGDHLMESLLLEYLPVIEWATGLELYPTYSFYRVYRRGHELTKHLDRPSCEISVTVSYGFSYSNSDYRWPIYMDDKPVILEPGDGAVYRGCDVEHWRDVLDVGQDSYHVQCFYHYVDKHGPFSDYAYDKKQHSHLQYLEALKK